MVADIETDPSISVAKHNKSLFLINITIYLVV